MRRLPLQMMFVRKSCLQFGLLLKGARSESITIALSVPISGEQEQFWENFLRIAQGAQALLIAPVFFCTPTAKPLSLLSPTVALLHNKVDIPAKGVKMGDPLLA